MILTHITVRNFGSLGCYDAEFTPELNIIATRHSPELLAAIEYLSGSKHRQSIPPWWIRENTHLSAGVVLGQTAYKVNAVSDNGMLKLTAEDSVGNDVTTIYQYALSHCPEQDGAEHFDGQDKSLPMRLCWYRNWADAPKDFSRRTEHLVDTKAFRYHLLRYIKTFQPEPIHCQKHYLASLNDLGEFQVLAPGVSGEVFLSETEEKLFLYICFLNIAEFWEETEKIRDLHHEKKPLLIQNFLEFLDESADVRTLIARTVRLRRQVFLFTLPPEAKRAGGQ